MFDLKGGSNLYKRIALILAVVSVLATVLTGNAAADVVVTASGDPIEGALVMLVDYPQYNDTTDVNGNYTLLNVPYGTYTISAIADGYATNTSTVTLDSSTVTKNFILETGIQYYLPFLYQRDDHVGYDYDAAVQVQNNGTSNSTVEIIFYNKNGTIAGSDVLEQQPGTLLQFSPFELTNIYPIFASAAVVQSSSPIQVQGYIMTKGIDVYSLAPSFTEASTLSYLPFLYHRVDNIGYNYDSGVQVFNPGSVAANVNIILYNKADGTEAANITYSVDPNNQVSKPLSGLVGGYTIWNGPAVITSDQPIVVQGYIRTTDSKVYSIAPSVSTPVNAAFLPFLYHRVDHVGFDYDSGVQVFNPGNVVANVNLKLYNKADGTEAANITYTVDPKIQVTKPLSGLVGGFTIWNGPAEITSDQPIVVQGFIRTTDSKIYSIAPQVRKPESPTDIHIPFLYQTINLSHDAGIQVTNPNTLPASVDETLYYRNGTKAGNVTITIPPYQQITKLAFSIAPNTEDFDGYAVISANRSVVAQAFIRQKNANIYSIAPPVER